MFKRKDERRARATYNATMRRLSESLRRRGLKLNESAGNEGRTVYLAYAADQWASNDSKRLIGVATDSTVDGLVNAIAEEPNFLTDEQKDDLESRDPRSDGSFTIDAGSEGDVTIIVESYGLNSYEYDPDGL